MHVPLFRQGSAAQFSRSYKNTNKHVSQTAKLNTTKEHVFNLYLLNKQALIMFSLIQ